MQLVTLHPFAVADTAAMCGHGAFEAVHGVVGETGRVDVFMLEDFQTLPHPFHAGGGDAGAERHGDAIVGEERAEPLPRAIGVAGDIYQQCPGVLSQQGLGFLSAGVYQYHGISIFSKDTFGHTKVSDVDMLFLRRCVRQRPPPTMIFGFDTLIVIQNQAY